MIKNNNKGNAVVSVILCAAFLILLFMPIFAAVLEKYIILNKAQILKASINISNEATYTALSVNNIGKGELTFDSAEAISIYSDLLAKNLNLNPELTPKTTSIATAKVEIEALILYTANLPIVCPNGELLTRPSIHSIIRVPVSPSLYKSKINSGQPIILRIHVDTDLPVNN